MLLESEAVFRITGLFVLKLALAKFDNSPKECVCESADGLCESSWMLIRCLWAESHGQRRTTVRYCTDAAIKTGKVFQEKIDVKDYD